VTCCPKLGIRRALSCIQQRKLELSAQLQRRYHTYKSVSACVQHHGGEKRPRGVSRQGMRDHPADAHQAQAAATVLQPTTSSLDGAFNDDRRIHTEHGAIDKTGQDVPDRSSHLPFGYRA
jgi:hypothetical protein